MKKIIIAVLAAWSIPAFPATVETDKNVPDYEIKKVSADATLNDSEAVVVFTCYEYTNFPMANRNLVYAHDKGANRDIKTDAKGTFRMTLKPGKHLFEIAHFGLEEIRIPDLTLKSKTQTEIALYFKEDARMQPMKKPVIYLYPATETQVNVKLDVKAGLDFTYPLYDKGWNFTADPNGDLHFGEKTYNYLFWEGNAKMEATDLNSNEGFVVNKNKLVEFFESKLKAMGLTSRERADFITYWAPLMNKNENCFVRFLFNDDLKKYALLSINPAPDQLFRVFMLWRPVENDKEIQKITGQQLPFIERKGFTVIEWGGTEIVPIKP